MDTKIRRVACRSVEGRSECWLEEGARGGSEFEVKIHAD